MTDLWVKILSRCIESERSSEEFGSWRESYDNTFQGVSLSKAYGDTKTPVDFDVTLGDTVYVLWAEYSSGDSFGRGERKYTDVIHVFKNPQLALAAKEVMAEERQDWTVEYKADSGKNVTYYRPWLGYFDSLENLHVEAVLVKA